jgi:hypothetical protein
MQKLLKTYSVLFVAIFYSAFCKAQDDLPDARRKTESFARFHIPEMRADLATFTLSGISESVGSTPLKKIPYTSLGEDSIVFEGDGIKAKVKIAPFDPAKHKLSFDEKYLVRIDRKPYYGNYLQTPKTEINEVLMIIDKDTVYIPAAAYNDLFNLNFTYLDKGVERTADAVYESKDGQKVYLYLFCKDKTGSYEVTWIFQNRKYLRRVLDYGFM